MLRIIKTGAELACDTRVQLYPYREIVKEAIAHESLHDGPCLKVFSLQPEQESVRDFLRHKAADLNFVEGVPGEARNPSLKRDIADADLTVEQGQNAFASEAVGRWFDRISQLNFYPEQELEDGEARKSFMTIGLPLYEGRHFLERIGLISDIRDNGFIARTLRRFGLIPTVHGYAPRLMGEIAVDDYPLPNTENKWYEILKTKILADEPLKFLEEFFDPDKMILKAKVLGGFIGGEALYGNIGALARHPHLLRELHIRTPYELITLAEKLDLDPAAPSLHERIGRRPIGENMKVVLDALDGMIARHRGCAEQGPLMHGDIKPLNILVTRDGETKLSDGEFACGEMPIERFFESITSSPVGTLIYSLFNHKLNKQGLKASSTFNLDFFSMAITAYDVLLGNTAERVQEYEAAKANNRTMNLPPALEDANKATSIPENVRRILRFMVHPGLAKEETGEKFDPKKAYSVIAGVYGDAVATSEPDPAKDLTVRV